jgi:signal transduction histidine kinase
VAAVSEGRFYTTIRLIGDDGTAELRVKILDQGKAPFTALTGRRLKARGVVESVFDNRGRRVAGTIWAASPNDVTLAPPTEQEWNPRRIYTVGELFGTNVLLPRFLRLSGRMIRKNPDGSYVVGEGANQLVVHGTAMAALPAGAAVKAAGFLARNGAAPVLEFAYLRAAGTNASVATLEETKPPEFNDQHPATEIREVNDLIKNWPNLKFPVRIRGVITYIDLGLTTFYLQDGSNGIPVQGSLQAGLYPLLEQEGMYVEIQGMVRNGSLYCTAPAAVLGKGRIPAPLRPSWDYLMTGRDDGLWVQVEGVVTASEKQRLILAMAGGQLTVWINQMDKQTQHRLLGSVARVSGICDPVLNGRRQRLGLRLLVPSGEYVELVTAAPDDPFAIRALPIGRVMQLNSDSAALASQLVKTVGTVTYKSPNMLFLQDGNDGIRVLPREEASVEAGDVVEAVGLAEPDGFSPKLAQALVRKISRGVLPAAKPLDVSVLNQDDAPNSTDATRERIEATFLGMSANESLHILQFRPDKSEKTFSAFIPVSAADMPSIPPGSRMSLEGVFKAKTDMAPDFGQVITSFEVYLNSPADIKVLARPSWWTTKHALWVLGGLAFVLTLALGWVGSLRREVAERTRELSAEIEERGRTGASLKAEIAERKKMEIQVRKTHEELLSASRKAGRAEVAISVLHNVGNVLNSINVSSSLVTERIRASRIAGIVKLSALLRENTRDLAGFFGGPKGRQVPAFLAELSTHLTREQEAILEEMHSLTANVEHIKEIVAMQQSYARTVGVFEDVEPAELLEDALRMNADALARHDIQVERDYGDPPSIRVDKHKVLQILVNLVRNAKYACDESGRADKRIRLSATVGEGRLMITVTDNGVGIPPGNLTRIFNHGFTTRKDGHGFGLHSGALAARELGGALSVHSAGAGLGAAFTLELPLVPPRPKTPDPSTQGAG